MPLSIACCSLVFLCHSIVCHSDPPLEEAAKVELERCAVWVRGHAAPIRTTDPNGDPSDLEPLARLAGRARIIALGEGTHGTREFFLIKHRALKHLVTRANVGLVAIEAGMAESRRLDDYVLKGEGDARELLRNLRFWAWNTQELLDLVEWMREHNRKSRHQVRFAGFDMQYPESAMASVRRFVAKVDSGALARLDRTWHRVRLASRQRAGSLLASRAFPMERAAGRRVRFSGWIRTEDLRDGRAALWWRVGGAPGEILALDSMEGRGPRGTTPWTRYEIELDVPHRGAQIRYGMLLAGQGVAWFDSMSVELDGEPWSEADVDLGFEDPDARGAWWASPDGYELAMDSVVAHSGRQSLRMRSIAGIEDSQRLAARAALPEVRQLVADLTHGRAHHAAVVPLGEVDRVIQDATTVRQCLEVLTGEVTRDECMARNVEWLLSHSPPGTKVALWAHNAHVARQSGSLGGYLARRHGAGLFTLGFTFHEGHFNAIREDRVQTNEAVPGIEGSAEAIFHAAGLPSFLLDMRKASSRDPASGWLGGELLFRSIGTLATDGFHVANIRRQYDAVVFVDRGTPSTLLP